MFHHQSYRSLELIIQPAAYSELKSNSTSRTLTLPRAGTLWILIVLAPRTHVVRRRRQTVAEPQYVHLSRVPARSCLCFICVWNQQKCLASAHSMIYAGYDCDARTKCLLYRYRSFIFISNRMHDEVKWNAVCLTVYRCQAYLQYVDCECTDQVCITYKILLPVVHVMKRSGRGENDHV